MTGPRVAIVRTGIANLASVANAFGRLGASAAPTDDASRVREAPFAVLPGVGAFCPAIHRLRLRGLDEAILDRVRTGRPLLAICLGMQLLCEASEEGGGGEGLGVLRGTVRRFPSELRVPQMGWNRVTPTRRAALIRGAPLYFANSFRLESLPPGWEGGMADYGGGFVAAAERGPLLACQFHPELSGPAGLSLLRRWLAWESVPC